jgi:hypothetical protein
MSNERAASAAQTTAVFEDIYRGDKWNGGSGPGSLPGVNRPYVRFLESFLLCNGIRSVVDLGCGDWQFSRGIDWGEARYLGLDLVAHVLERNRRIYGRESVEFASAPADPAKLPEADLLLVKDVFQHLSNRSILDHLAVFPKYKYVLVTNCSKKSRDLLNTDIADGGFRPLDLRLDPFGMPMACVLQYGADRTLNLRRLAIVTPGVKQVFLWTRT